MSARLVACVLLFTVVVGCQGESVSEPSAAAPAQSEAGATDTAGASSTEGGAAGDDTSGTGSPLSDGGGAGEALDNVWTKHTQHIDIRCFGFVMGYAEFRAKRSELNEEQITKLAQLRSVPPSRSIQDNETNCSAETLDDAGIKRTYAVVGAYDQGATSEVGTLMGCEFSAGIPSYDGVGPAPALPLPTGLGYSAMPLCVRYLQTTTPVVTYNLDLDTPGKLYRIALEDCYRTPSKVELYGSDPSTPLATGVTPVDSGPHHVCSALEVQVDAPTTGRLIISNSGDDQHLVFY